MFLWERSITNQFAEVSDVLRYNCYYYTVVTIQKDHYNADIKTVLVVLLPHPSSQCTCYPALLSFLEKSAYRDTTFSFENVGLYNTHEDGSVS